MGTINYARSSFKIAIVKIILKYLVPVLEFHQVPVKPNYLKTNGESAEMAPKILTNNFSFHC